DRDQRPRRPAARPRVRDREAPGRREAALRDRHRSPARRLRRRDPPPRAAPPEDRRQVTRAALAALPAHGVGSREDLPLPLTLLLIGAGLALVVSFAALGALWKQPRLRPEDGRLLPMMLALALDSAAVRGLFVIASLTITGWTLLALALGKDNANNPVPSVVYVWLWVGLAFISMVFGGIWRLVNPVRWLHRGILALLRIEPDIALAEDLREYESAAQ